MEAGLCRVQYYHQHTHLPTHTLFWQKSTQSLPSSRPTTVTMTHTLLAPLSLSLPASLRLSGPRSSQPASLRSPSVTGDTPSHPCQPNASQARPRAPQPSSLARALWRRHHAGLSHSRGRGGGGGDSKALAIFCVRESL